MMANGADQILLPSYTFLARLDFCKENTITMRYPRTNWCSCLEKEKKGYFAPFK